MKFLIFLFQISTLCIVVLEITCSTFKSKLRSKSKLRHKKIQTMPDYLAALDKANAEQNNQIEQNKETKVVYFVNRSKINRTKRRRPLGNPDILLENSKDLTLLHEGWLKVSSSDLKKTHIYSRLILPDWRQHEIVTERNFFRVNLAYNPFNRGIESPPGPFYFYTRLSNRNLFYSPSKDSINVLASLQISEVRDAYELPDFARQDQCFEVNDAQKRVWTLCAETVIKRNEWVCILREKIQKADFGDLEKCLNKLDADRNIPIITQKITEPMLLIPLASPMCNENFNYNQLGADWECDCREGNIIFLS